MITKPIFETLIQQIETAGLEARAYFDADDTSNVEKADGSVVTAVDQSIEVMLVSYIREHFPKDSIAGEEGGRYVGDDDFVWHIDPVDGTDNFLRKIPFCAISVARLGSTAEDSLAVVHNPITSQTFSVFMDEGVIENERVHQLTDNTLGSRLIISVCGGKQEAWMKKTKYNLFAGLGLAFGKGTSLGCCALELAYVAANRIYGVLIFGLYSYDYAAGLYLVKSAGGTISVFRDGQWREWTGSLKSLCAAHNETIFVSHEGLHTEALALIGDPHDWANT